MLRIVFLLLIMLAASPFATSAQTDLPGKNSSATADTVKKLCSVLSDRKLSSRDEDSIHDFDGHGLSYEVRPSYASRSYVYADHSVIGYSIGKMRRGKIILDSEVIIESGIKHFYFINLPARYDNLEIGNGPDYHKSLYYLKSKSEKEDFIFVINAIKALCPNAKFFLVKGASKEEVTDLDVFRKLR